MDGEDAWVGDALTEWAGDVMGRFALGDESVTAGDLVEAVGVSVAMNAQTADELLDPRTWYVADLFSTP